MRCIRLRRANALAPLTVPLPNQLRITRERFRRGQLRRIKIPPVTALAAKRRDATLSRNTRSGNNENTHARNARCNGACVNSRKPSESSAEPRGEHVAGKRWLSYGGAFMSRAMHKQIILVAVTLFTSSVFVFSATDTPETRRREAERYLQVSSPKALFEDMADKMGANLPADQREQFKRVMTTQLDIAALTKAMMDAMVKNFTTDELKALADFYGSPVGKSAMKKFGTYMADIMPVMQAEIIKASAKLNQSLPNQSPH